MNDKEIGEIRRHLRRDRSNITAIHGCYVNENKEIISQFRQSTGMMPENESDKYFALLRRTLSGSIGKNLIDITFKTSQVAGSPEHQLLMDLRKTQLKDEELLQSFFQKVIENVDMEGNYLILLSCDTYDGFSEAFGSLLGMKWYTLLIVAALLAMGIVMCRQQKGSWNAKRLSYAAMCIAIAFVLSCIKLFRMPQGGSVTPAAMLPLIMFALACGPAQGLVTGCAFGLLQMIEDFYVIHPVQLLVDYPMAYAALTLGCLALLLPEKYDRLRLPLAVLLGYLGRYAMATLSGAVFFAEYAGEQNAWIYSLSYNLSYLGVEAVIACVIACIPGFNRILKAMKKLS